MALFEREIRERLSKAALDLLFARAEVISEGQRATRAGKPVYFGSTMLTLDLTAVAGAVRDSCDAGTARRLANLLRTDAGAATRIKSIAGREATRICGSKPKSVSTELRIEARGARVLIDVDVEGTL